MKEGATFHEINNQRDTNLDFERLYSFLSEQHETNYYLSSKEFKADMLLTVKAGGRIVYSVDETENYCGFVSATPHEISGLGINILVVNNVTSTVGRLPFVAGLMRKAVVPFRNSCTDVVFLIDPASVGGERRFAIYQWIGFKPDARFANRENPRRICLSMPVEALLTKLEHSGGGENYASR